MDMRRLVGRNVARLRKAQGLTQEEVEARSGLSQQYLSSLERGRRNPTIVTLYVLAQTLGVDHLDLVRPDDQGLAEKEARVEKARARSGKP